MPHKQSNKSEDKFEIDELLLNSWRFRSTDEFVKFFKFIGKFNHYSRYNTMLVYIQNPAVTFFGGVSFWRKKFFRSVKKDARPYIILVPKGPVMLVYDVFETEGDETPEELLENGLGTDFKVKGSISEAKYDYAIELAEKWGIKIEYRPLNYFQGGYITTITEGILEICLKENETREKNFSTLIHELAHLFLGHAGHKKIKLKDTKQEIKLPIRNKIGKSAMELEAETVNYLVSKKIGIETPSILYIASHITEEALLNFNYNIVIKTVDKIEKLFIYQKKTKI